MNQQEEWRTVVGFPDYEVSDRGRVISHRRRKPVLLRSTKPAKGYPQVVVVNDHRSVTRNVHQLVAEAFLGPRPEPTYQIRHLNGKPLDCRASNLAWGTPRENMLDKQRHGTDHNAAKTHCPQGHAYDDENTYRAPSRPGGRYCRACNRATAAARQRAYRQRQMLRAAGISSSAVAA